MTFIYLYSNKSLIDPVKLMRCIGILIFAFNNIYSLTFGYLGTTLNRMELKWRNNVIHTHNVNRSYQSRILPSIPLITLFRPSPQIQPSSDYTKSYERTPNSRWAVKWIDLNSSTLNSVHFHWQKFLCSSLLCFPSPLLSFCHFNPFEGDEFARGFFFLILSTVGEDNKRYFLLLDYTSRRIDGGLFI